MSIWYFLSGVIESKELEKNFSKSLLTGPIKGARGPNCCMTLSEIMTIQIAFQMIGYRNFKTFHTGYVKKYWLKYFPSLLSYNRFVELMPHSLCPLTIFLKTTAIKQLIAKPKELAHML